MDKTKDYIELYNSLKWNYYDEYEGMVYHYTSPEGLKGILDTSCIYATDMYFLNDASEGMYVVKLISDNIEEVSFGDVKFKEYILHELEHLKKGKWNELIHHYTISFSLNDDSLAMWNYYTKGNSIQGYNIGFDVMKLTDNIEIQILDRDGKRIERNKNKHLVLYHGRVIYDKIQQTKIVSEIFKAFYSLYKESENDWNLENAAHFAVAKTMDFGKFFKDKQFDVEEEYRLMFSTYLLNGKNNSEMGIPYKELYRTHEGCFVPYQKCLINKDSISMITFSPSLHNEMTEAGLKRMLNTYGIDKNVTVRKSNISLRF
jgi:hypothetical protein